MIIFQNGDLFESGAEAIVNPVNTHGVMGKGLALQFKKRFPGNFAAYKEACRNGDVRTGEMFLFREMNDRGAVWVVNFPTKEHWRGKSKMEWVENGLRDLRRQIQELGWKSIALPAIGCGLGGLPWGEVKKRIEEELLGLEEVQIIVFPPR